MKGALAVFAVAFGLLAIRAFEPPASPLDEFLPLVCGQRILAGEVPYRDFTTLYTPLTSLFSGLVVLSFGRSLLATRLAFAAFAAGNVVLVRSIAARLTSSTPSTLGVSGGVALLAACSQGTPPWGYSLVLATFFVLAAMRCVLHGGRWAVAAGALLGLAALARHDTALLAALPVLAAARSRREALVAAGVAALLPLGFVIFLAATGALGAAFEQLVVIPATLYPKIRGLPWPLPWRAPGDLPLSPSLASVYGPFIVSALAIGRTSREKLACAALPFALGAGAFVRPDRAHVYGAWAASFVALALLASDRRRLAIALALLLPGAGLSLLGAVRALSAPTSVDAPRARVLERIAGPPRIFVALPRHDRIWINDVRFYFESGALPATRHHELYPLVATTREVQEEIVRDLERWRPAFVVVSDVKIAREPNASAETFPVRVLDDFLAAHYALDLDEERYKVLRLSPSH